MSPSLAFLSFFPFLFFFLFLIVTLTWLLAQVGTGEYTTGFVGGGASKSDKKVGVVGLTLFDLRRRGKVGKLSMVGVSGDKFPAIRTDRLRRPAQAKPSLIAARRAPREEHLPGLQWP
jgi:hypothetical protein